MSVPFFDLLLGTQTRQKDPGTVGTFSGIGTIVLKVNGVIETTWNFALIIGSGEAADSMASHDFPVGFKIATGEIIKLECTVAGTDVLTEGQLVGWEETTGVNPLVDF